MRSILLVCVATCLVLSCSKPSEQVEAKTYEVVITGNPDGRSINAIKGIREVTGLGLADAKALFDNMPSVVKTDLTKEEAEGIARTLRASSLTVEIKEK